MKKLFLLSMLFCASVSFSQDVIVKKDGSTIISKVLEINTSDIKYKKQSNLNGPTYTISKSEIMSINYANGEKDDFNEPTTTSGSGFGDTPQGYVKKPGDKRNEELIKLYNKQYNFQNVNDKNTAAKYLFLIFGLKTSSVLSNEDIEIRFVRDRIKFPGGSRFLYDVYYVNILNKTNRTIYIDRGNSFRLYNNGDYFCYYDNSEQTTVNMGGGSGGSLGLGSLAGALGVGGAAGQLAGGVRVGGGTNHSVSKTYSQQRVIAIPPHGNKNLTEEKWVQTKKGWNEEWVTIEEAERFEGGNYKDIGIKGMINRGQVLVYDENNSPWKREYFITYSKEENFSTYSTLNAELYLHEAIGCNTFENEDMTSGNNKEKYIEGFNEYTLMGVLYHYENGSLFGGKPVRL